MINEIATHIANLTGLTIGTDLFVGWRPEDAPRRSSVILERSGSEVTGDHPDWFEKMIQVLTRSENYQEAREDAFLIFYALHGRAGDDLPELTSGERYLAMVIDAQSDPQYIGEDEKRNHEFSTNYLFRIESEVCSSP